MLASASTTSNAPAGGEPVRFDYRLYASATNSMAMAAAMLDLNSRTPPGGDSWPGHSRNRESQRALRHKQTAVLVVDGLQTSAVSTKAKNKVIALVSLAWVSVTMMALMGLIEHPGISRRHA